MSFESALKFSLLWEGGEKYTNDPDDPGGETKYGISKRAHPTEDIKNLSYERAAQLYRPGYWFEGLSEPLATVAFDTAVNVGRGRVSRWLEPLETMDPVTAAKALCDRRAEHYREIMKKNPKLLKYRNGWFNRLNALRKHAGLGTA